MALSRFFRMGALAAACLLLGGFAAGRGAPKALAQLQPGLWEIRDLDNKDAQVRSICLADPVALVQLGHSGAECSRLLVEDNANASTVSYTCSKGGFGRTSVRVETPRLARIDTQGIADQAPFAFRAQARRLGACTAR
jgi:hypothetical protein